MKFEKKLLSWKYFSAKLFPKFSENFGNNKSLFLIKTEQGFEQYTKRTKPPYNAINS